MKNASKISKDDLIELTAQLEKANPGSVLAQLIRGGLGNKSEFSLDDADAVFSKIEGSLQAKGPGKETPLFDLLRGEEEQLSKGRFFEVAKQMQLQLQSQELQQLFYRLSKGSQYVSRRDFQIFVSDID